MTIRRALAIISVILATVVSAVGYLSAQGLPENSMPFVGFPVHDTILSYMPNGGSLLFVSESCISCQNRASSFIAAVAQPDHLLLVQIDGVNSVFQDLVRENPTVVDRVVFLSRTEIRNLTNVRSVPTYVIIDDRGRVIETGPSTVGWLKGMVNPANWMRSWARLLE